VDNIEVNLCSETDLACTHKIDWMIYNSSIASCIGIGSSNPRLIISQEKLSSRLRPMFGIISGSGIIPGAMLVMGSMSGSVVVCIESYEPSGICIPGICVLSWY